MKTTNIISTPDITGNIGTCTSTSVEVQSGRTFFIKNTETLVTNSCNGSVEHFQTWNFSGIGVLSFLLAIGFIWFVAVGVLDIIKCSRINRN